MGNFLSGNASPTQLDKKKNFGFEEMLQIVRTGDIILLSGSSLDSQVIEGAINTQWSHVLLVLIMPDPRVDPRDGEVLVPVAFESVYSSHIKHDIQGHSAESGVRLVFLKEYLAGYTGFVAAVRPLTVVNREYLKSMWNYMAKGLAECARAYRGRPYETRKLEFVMAWIGGCMGRATPTPDEMFCSELVATCLSNLGMLDTSMMAPNEFTPDSLSSASTLKLKSPNVELLGPQIKYGHEFYFRLPSGYHPKSWWAVLAKHLCG